MADVLIAVFCEMLFCGRESISEQFNRRNCSPHVARRYKSLIIVLKNELPCSEEKARLKMRLDTFGIRFFMRNRKLQFSVARLQFYVVEISNVSKAFSV